MKKILAALFIFILIAVIYMMVALIDRVLAPESDKNIAPNAATTTFKGPGGSTPGFQGPPPGAIPGVEGP